MRKLASIQVIEEIKAIPGADVICAYRVGGWWVVDKVNAYQVGDRAIMCEIDCWIPNHLAPFLSKGKEPREYNGVKGEKLRTVRLKKQLSQGLLLPLSCLTNYGADLEDGEDVSEVLGIQKWEPPVDTQLAGMTKGNWPSFLPKTDQERIQNLSRDLSKWKEDKFLAWEVTEKLEGSSITMYIDHDGEFNVCSRNINLKETEDNTFWKVARKYDIESHLRRTYDLGFKYAVQGELVGPGIQDNIYGFNEHKLFIYDIYDYQKGEYLLPSERRSMCKFLDVPHAPVIDPQFFLGDHTIDSLLEMADGQTVVNGNHLREGLVFKSNNHHDISFKTVSNKYLENEK